MEEMPIDKSTEIGEKARARMRFVQRVEPLSNSLNRTIARVMVKEK